ncbi:hypothetical protein IFM89_010995 [Coptis chinensis]|uniref:Glycosyltransferase n=1 Tax=Coptis chinensis TaxID=261450 RepID=A0A835M5R9_9MAGN|nr:hypothetical protein IFM89_010995 [Coptis chinensis]
MQLIMESSKPHVAIISSPGMGHVIPCLELAKCLVSYHDVEVSFFVPSTEASVQQTQLLESLVVPEDLHIIKLPPVDISNIVPINNEIVARLTLIVQESLPDVRSEILKSPRPPTVLISDMFSTHAFEIADDFKMAKYLFCTFSATVLAYMMYTPKLAQETNIDSQEIPESLNVPGCKPVLVQDLGGRDRLFHLNGGKVQSVFGHIYNYAKASAILVNTFEDLEPQTLQGLSDDNVRWTIPMPPLYPVGPIIKSAESPSIGKSDYYLAWLDNQPSGSVLFISFGSGGTLSADQTNELALGLELSKQRFLWVVRPPQDFTPAAYISAVGGVNDPSEYLPDGFLTRTSGIGLVIPNWVSQIDVLNHGSIGAFLSHCGWNSILESLVNGVPLLTWPLYAEQHWNAMMLTQDFGVAVQLAKASEEGVVGRERIERAVRLVMEEEEGKVLRNRAKELKSSAIKTMGKDGSSYGSLSKLVKKWNEISCPCKP